MYETTQLENLALCVKIYHWEKARFLIGKNRIWVSIPVV